MKNLHLLLDILHAALPSGNTCQMCNKSLQKNAIPLPDATTCQMRNKTFVVNGQQRRTDRITNGEIVLYLDVRRCGADAIGDLVITKE